MNSGGGCNPGGRQSCQGIAAPALAVGGEAIETSNNVAVDANVTLVDDQAPDSCLPVLLTQVTEFD